MEATRTDPLKPAILTLAAVQAVIGLSQAIAPGWFYENFANFGARADHMMRDVASYYLASAVALLAAAGRRSWRLPVLALVTIQYALHVLNHLLDIGNAEPGWIGPAEAVALLAGVGVFAWLTILAAREEQQAA